MALAVWALAVSPSDAAGGRWWRRWPVAGGRGRRWLVAGGWRWWLALRAGRRWWPLGLLALRWWRAVPALALRPGGGAAALKTVINQRFARFS